MEYVCTGTVPTGLVVVSTRVVVEIVEAGWVTVVVVVVDIVVFDIGGVG